MIWKSLGRITEIDPTSIDACCEMEGVYCDSESSQRIVTKINWENQELKGKLLPEIGKLTNLRKL